jgi:hypothetical protein
MIPPDAQRAMSKRAGSTVAEVKGRHAVHVSQPKAVADLIAKAANGVTLATREACQPHRELRRVRSGNRAGSDLAVSTDLWVMSTGVRSSQR